MVLGPLPFSILAVLAIWIVAAPVAAAQESGAATRPATRPRIAVLTFSGGFKHGVLELAEKTIRDIGEQSGAFEAVCLRQFQQPSDRIDLSSINADWLRQFAGLVFYTTSGDKDLDLLTPAQRDALIGAIRSGTAFIGIHSATDTFYKWPEYGEMIGAYFDGHPWGADSAPVTIRIEDRDHPATLHLGPSWFLQEEIYQFRAPYQRDKLHVLMSLDTTATDMSVKGINRTDGDFALAWTRLYGKGRVFYTALGHRDDVWANTLFRKHLLGGIRWALGLAPGRPESQSSAGAANTRLESGLEYADLEPGHGPAAKRYDKVKVHYTGWLLDGTKLASSRDSGEPMSFVVGVGLVIRGWDEGIPGMKVGGKRRLVVPPGLGYGVRGDPPAIPPSARLIYEIELLAIEN